MLVTTGAQARKGWSRIARVNELLKEVLAEELERSLSGDEPFGMVTITGVQVSGDLSVARVYVEPGGDAVMDFLEDVRGQLRREIGRQVRMKRVPRLAFVADPAVEMGDRVEVALRRIHSRESLSGGGGTGPDAEDER